MGPCPQRRPKSLRSMRGRARYLRAVKWLGGSPYRKRACGDGSLPPTSHSGRRLRPHLARGIHRVREPVRGRGRQAPMRDRPDECTFKSSRPDWGPSPAVPPRGRTTNASHRATALAVKASGEAEARSAPAALHLEAARCPGSAGDDRVNAGRRTRAYPPIAGMESATRPEEARSESEGRRKSRAGGMARDGC